MTKQLTLVPAQPLRPPRPRPDLARALHDTVLQTLELIARGGPDGSGDGADLCRLAADAARDLRELIEPTHDDSPGSLAEEMAAVVRRAQRLSRVDIALVVGVTDGSLPADQVRALCGAAAEALNNARKHSQATRVVVFVEEVHGEALCTVRDDGIGMAVSSARGFGITGSLMERMHEADGDVDFESAPGRGTKVTLVAHRKAA